MTTRVNLAFFLQPNMGSMYAPHEIAVDFQDYPLIEVNRSKVFVEIDFAINYKLNSTENLATEISLGIKNITDQYQDVLDVGVDRVPGYVYGQSSPRTVYFNLGFK